VELNQSYNDTRIAIELDRCALSNVANSVVKQQQQQEQEGCVKRGAAETWISQEDENHNHVNEVSNGS